MINQPGQQTGAVIVSSHQIMQRLIGLFPATNYLEIGVDHGTTFVQIQAASKVGVDPKFNFDYLRVAAEQPSARFHEITSDAFFALPEIRGQKFDVIFLDGLHTFDQTLRDLLNAVQFLAKGGVIVVDDTIPDCHYASLTDFEEIRLIREFLARRDPNILKHGAWMGDVFKVPLFVESFLQQFSYATIAETHGQTVIWEKPRLPEQVGRFTAAQVANLDFGGLVRNESHLLLTPFETIVQNYIADRALLG
jgi:SAM-dependent methyltransferase